MRTKRAVISYVVLSRYSHIIKLDTQASKLLDYSTIELYNTMTLTEDEPVLVEHTDADAAVGGSENATEVTDDEDESPLTLTEETADDDNGAPRPYQIVSIGTEDDKFAFTFHEKELNEIMSKIPPGWKVAVVSVVGAYRTGKSFLLSWFLRYLHHIGKKSQTDSEEKPWYETFESLGNDGFDWRGGSERNTTGIWMWSQPQFVSKTVNGKTESMAVLLVDSQGMFDNETTMSLTTSIFGLSTLLSSYQIYNVDKRIQEDNLQQLALFSEYARIALDADRAHKSDEKNKPFQKIEFLVRDWQHFEEEEDYAKMETEMKAYLDKVIADRDAKDLQETREQIVSCFEDISCYGLCHPGMQVVKKKFDGDVKAMDEDFLHLLDRYCQRVFNMDNLEPKSIQGRQVTAVELGAYIKAYAEMFASGAKFPEASTMLEATASANNTNAVHLALTQYKDTMNRIAGPKCSNYIKPNELKDDHKNLFAKSLHIFDSMATFGNKKSIEEAREGVVRQMQEDYEVYESLNTSRNPLAGLET
jgi:atlastin